MKVYLDSSALNRLFDDQTQARIYLEASAMLVIFELTEQQHLTLVSSEAIDFELRRNPFTERRLFVHSVLTQAKQYQSLEPEIVSRAQQLERQGIKALDALHLACAETLAADVFITCDDKLLKSTAPQVAVVHPSQFVVDLMREGEPKNGSD